MRCTIAQALRDMRHLRATDAGRLRGIHLRYSAVDLPRKAITGTPQPLRDQLRAGIDARAAGTVTGDSPEYLVLSDGTVVAVLTAAARVLLANHPLSPLQTRHQQAAAEALNDLHRYVLADLADLRAVREGHPQATAAGHAPQDGTLRVAPHDDLTHTRWTRIGADPAIAHRAVRVACGNDTERILIITAVGYGAYGRDRHRLPLDMLCAMHRIADTHQVSLHTIGDWLDAEGATTADVDPATAVDQFAAAYLGPFRDERDYTRHRMDQLGWTRALRTAGIPEGYLDLPAITHDWFGQQVRRVDSATRDHIEVFHRNRPGAGTETPS